MNRYFITGASGFVSRHFIEHIESTEPDARILGTDKCAPSFRFEHDFRPLELLDFSGVERMIADFDPTVLVHFASHSSVASSWIDPSTSFTNNTNIFLNILEAIRKNRIACRILSIGSSEEYGIVDPRALPLGESAALDPNSPYAVARVAQENLSKVYAKSFGLDIVMTRSFNHVGPGQRPDFVIPSIVKQFLDSEGGEVELSVGDVSIVRDFLDVRDVVRAYRLLLQRGESSEAYNVCSGIGVSISQVIEIVSSIASRDYSVSVDSSRIRPSDNRAIIGDNSKLVRATGWKQSIALRESIEDIFAEMRDR